MTTARRESSGRLVHYYSRLGVGVLCNTDEFNPRYAEAVSQITCPACRAVIEGQHLHLHRAGPARDGGGEQ
jgi:hypothetical protein